MSLDYASEKLAVAVDTLATGLGRIQERLADAYTSSVMRIEPERDLPAQLWREFNAIAAVMTSAEPVGDEGSIEASASRMSDGEAQSVAEAILKLRDDVEEALREGDG